MKSPEPILAREKLSFVGQNFFHKGKNRFGAKETHSTSVQTTPALLNSCVSVQNSIKIPRKCVRLKLTRTWQTFGFEKTDLAAVL